ncbi:sporulation histidine kinase inhibitor Sda [Salipaludibacillus keqinensis]|uniref:Sporulation histidine kinase inhibitor Sda n=1 Tax=Salipaludibacillus keqinensis TaxID=2045207 RepID=A0A323TJX9_9BACI|nr:sporulation histidine kinase inhibitor Sda [Salipaludibacillus keqinensis]PYZ95301.1 sporulation histidine kinase inhibitor Sda [Salipaludibacillus keqinensis]
MRDISDELLLETYKKAIELDLSEDFLLLILDEIDRRSNFTRKIDL